MDKSRPEGVEKLTASQGSGTMPSSLDTEEYRHRAATARPASGPGPAEAGPDSSDEPFAYPAWWLAIVVALLVSAASLVVQSETFVIPWPLGLSLLLMASIPVTAMVLRKTEAQPSTAMRVYTLVIYAVHCAGMPFVAIVLWVMSPMVGPGPIRGVDLERLWGPLGVLLCGFGVLGTVVFTIRIARLAIRLLRTRSFRRVR